MDLSRRQLDVLRILRFREAGQADPQRQVCWVGRQPRNRWMLVVPNLFGTWEQLTSVNGATLADLELLDLIEYGPDGQLPDHIARRGASFGGTLRLTPAGHEVLAD